MDDVLRTRMYNLFCESEIRLDAQKMFRNGDLFDVFHYDSWSQTIAVKPAKGIHARMHNPIQAFPSEDECEELWRDDKLVVYHVDPSYGSPMQMYGYVDRQKWEQNHSSHKSLLLAHNKV